MGKQRVVSLVNVKKYKTNRYQLKKEMSAGSLLSKSTAHTLNTERMGASNSVPHTGIAGGSNELDRLVSMSIKPKKEDARARVGGTLHLVAAALC